MHIHRKQSRAFASKVTDLMGPPHHEVREDSNPQNRAQEGENKEFSGFLKDKVSYGKAKCSMI